MKTLTFTLLFVVCAFVLTPYNVFAQRKVEKLDRGVVAAWKSNSDIFVSWRLLATDPDDIAFNVYREISGSAPEKLNSAPIADRTNFVATGQSSRSSASRFTVRPVIKGVEVEDAAGGYWELEANAPVNTGTNNNGRNGAIVKDFDYEPVPGVAAGALFMTYCWVADLNGDGKYDFVLERQGSGRTLLEAYSSEGVFLWRVDVGQNSIIAEGHNDMVTAFDMDGDGKAEVLLAVSEGTTFADGRVITGANGTVKNYRNNTDRGSAPQWLSVIDGMTGVEIDRAELPHLNELQTTRTDDQWKHIQGHFVIGYLDGINPHIMYQYKNRLSNGNFQGALAAWRFVDKKLDLYWSHKFYPNQNEFHQVTSVDIDADGRDDFIEGGYVINSDGALHHHNKGAVHGDRHHVADINPDRPGLEHFVIQQDNSSRMAMGYYDASTGELIRGYYMTYVTDVARGIVAPLDPTLRGMQFVSSDLGRAVYDCWGNATGYALGQTPGGVIWWDGELSRQHTRSTDGNGNNFVVEWFNPQTKGFDRIFEIGRATNKTGNEWYIQTTSTRAHPAFRGDILGDWREEIVVRRADNTGFAVVTTTMESPHRIYCLMQNPGYRNNTTARGYYQAPDLDYYIAADMPQPPVPPVQKADLYYSGTGWIDYNNAADTYVDGKSIMFDLRGGNSAFTLNGDMAPSHLWIVNPKGQDYTFDGDGKFTGSMGLTKSLQGTATLNGNHDYTGITRISEGKLIINGEITGKVRIDARGVLSGNATLKGGVVLEKGLNAEGGRIEPGNGAQPGTLTIDGDLTLVERNNLAFTVDKTNSSLVINGDFTVSGKNHSLIVNMLTKPIVLEQTLITYTGESNVTAESFNVLGLEGMPFEIKFEPGKVILVRNMEPPVITTISLPDGRVGDAYATVLKATGYQPIEWFLDSDGLPDGLSLSENGDISGTPYVHGTYTFTVKATNIDGSETKQLAIVVANVKPPVITTTSLPDGRVGEVYDTVLEATGYPPVEWILDSGDLPDGLSLSENGNMSGTACTAGTFTFTVKVTNPGGSETKQLTIEIAKGEGAEVAAPTLDEATYSSISINAVESPENGQEVEYAIINYAQNPIVDEWQTKLTFDSLSEETLYLIFARAAENENYHAGAISEPLSVTTAKLPPTGIDNPLKTNPLKAWVNNGSLHVAGLVAGKAWQIYSVSGMLLYQKIAASEEEKVSMSEQGVYIVVQEENSVKVVF